MTPKEFLIPLKLVKREKILGWFLWIFLLTMTTISIWLVLEERSKESIELFFLWISVPIVAGLLSFFEIRHEDYRVLIDDEKIQVENGRAKKSVAYWIQIKELKRARLRNSLRLMTWSGKYLEVNTLIEGFQALESIVIKRTTYPQIEGNNFLWKNKFIRLRSIVFGGGFSVLYAKWISKFFGRFFGLMIHLPGIRMQEGYMQAWVGSSIIFLFFLVTICLSIRNYLNTIVRVEVNHSSVVVQYSHRTQDISFKDIEGSELSDRYVEGKKGLGLVIRLQNGKELKIIEALGLDLYVLKATLDSHWERAIQVRDR